MSTLKVKNANGVSTEYVTGGTSVHSNQAILGLYPTGGETYLRFLRNVLVPQHSFSTLSLSPAISGNFAVAGFYNSSTSLELFYREAGGTIYRTTLNLTTGSFTTPAQVITATNSGLSQVIKLADNTVFVVLRNSSGYNFVYRQYLGSGSFTSVTLPYTTGVFQLAEMTGNKALCISRASSSPYYWRHWYLLSDGTYSNYTVDTYALERPSNIIPLGSDKFLVCSTPITPPLTEGQYYYRFFESGALTTPVAFGNDLGAIADTSYMCRITRPNDAVDDSSFTATINAVLASENYESGFSTVWTAIPFSANLMYLMSTLDTQESLYWKSSVLTIFGAVYGKDTLSKTLFPTTTAGVQAVTAEGDIGTLYE